jgi:hypothetical protein
VNVVAFAAQKPLPKKLPPLKKLLLKKLLPNNSRSSESTI